MNTPRLDKKIVRNITGFGKLMVTSINFARTDSKLPSPGVRDNMAGSGQQCSAKIDYSINPTYHFGTVVSLNGFAKQPLSKLQ